MKRSWLVALWVSLWSIVAIIASTTAFIALRGNQLSDWVQLFRPMWFYYLSWGVFSLLIYQLVWRLSDSLRKILWQLILHVALFAFITLGLNLLLKYPHWRDWVFGDRAPGYLTLSVMIYLIILLGSVIIRYFQLLRRQEKTVRDERLKNSLLANQLNLTQMEALKMQINPHFLFNALNAIAALIETDRKVEAYHATELLGELLRESLQFSEVSYLPLSKELAMSQRYVDMQQMRFGDRFHYQCQCADDLLTIEVPALVLQPLIENVFKHAVGQGQLGVDIKLTVAREGAFLKLCLSNSQTAASTPQKTQATDSGLGLKNLRERLQLLFDRDDLLSLTDQVDRYVATLTLPINTGENR